MSIGGKGVISVLSNMSVKDVRAIVDPATKGDFATAAKEHVRLFKLMKKMFMEPNPVPCKYCLSQLGRMEPMVRLPLVPASESTKAELDALLTEYGFK